MDEDATVLLIEVFDGLGFRVELHRAGDGGREFLFREVDACNLRVEGRRD